MFSQSKVIVLTLVYFCLFHLLCCLHACTVCVCVYVIMFSFWLLKMWCNYKGSHFKHLSLLNIMKLVILNFKFEDNYH